MMPSLIIIVGFILVLMGGCLAIGVGTFDIVKVLTDLGFPVWGFIVLFLAQWSSQLVNNYSMGLALCNMFDVNDDKGRAKVTAVATVIGIIAAVAGILDQFMNFLILAALVYPPIASIMVTDYFFVRKKQWKDIPGWNWIATIAMVIGTIFGYITQYVFPWGIPAVQSWIVTGIVYYGLMYLKARVAPDVYTPEHWGTIRKTEAAGQ